MDNSDHGDGLTNECKELLPSLPRERGWRTPYIYQFQDFWCQPKQIQSILSFQKHFQAKDSDVLMCSIPKSGTTWLKAIAFAIINREKFPPTAVDHPLLTSNSHDLVPFFEYDVYAKNNVPDLTNLPEPRLFGTHVPFASLHESIKSSNCKIVYICRNPFDTFISSWIYTNKLRHESVTPLSIEEAFDMFCDGMVGYGPFWKHMLGYWNESLERPNKVLFLKYEDMKEDVVCQLKRIAQFLGCPFSLEEESGRVIEEVAKLCSMEKMKDLEVNKNGKSIADFENKHLFRKGEVGDFVNYLSANMVVKLQQIIEEKLGGSNLQFKVI